MVEIIHLIIHPIIVVMVVMVVMVVLVVMVVFFISVHSKSGYKTVI